MSNARATYTKVAAPRRAEFLSAQRWELFPHLVVVMVLLTLVSIFHVWSRVKVIDLNMKLAESTRLLKSEQQEQNRLRLEVASLKTPARIEEVAKRDLGMALPTDQQVVNVR